MAVPMDRRTSSDPREAPVEALEPRLATGARDNTEEQGFGDGASVTKFSDSVFH